MNGPGFWIVDVMMEANLVVVCWKLNSHCASSKLTV